MRRTIILTAVALSLAQAACHHKESPGGLKRCLARDTGSWCTGPQCGAGNSPHINTFPINGLSPTGECNDDRVQLIPGSLSGPHCPAGSSLDFDPYKRRLIGRTATQLTCEGTNLKDATFKVRGPADNDVVLKIAEVRGLKKHPEYEGYKIVHGNDTSACDDTASREIWKALGLKGADHPIDNPPIIPDGSTPDLDDELAVVVDSPIFNMQNAKVLFPHGEFFNLACSDDALAKVLFYDLAEGEQWTTAALRMLTARYDGTHPYTVRGMTIDVVVHQDKQDRTLEARWDADGKALCISNPRLLWLVKDGKTIDPTTLPKDLQPPGCEKGDKGKCDGPQWTAKLREQAGVPTTSCPDVAPVPANVKLESYVTKDGKLILSPQGTGAP